MSSDSSRSEDQSNSSRLLSSSLPSFLSSSTRRLSLSTPNILAQSTSSTTSASFSNSTGQSLYNKIKEGIDVLINLFLFQLHLDPHHTIPRLPSPHITQSSPDNRSLVRTNSIPSFLTSYLTSSSSIGAAGLSSTERMSSFSNISVDHRRRGEYYFINQLTPALIMSQNVKSNSSSFFSPVNPFAPVDHTSRQSPVASGTTTPKSIGHHHHHHHSSKGCRRLSCESHKNCCGSSSADNHNPNDPSSHDGMESNKGSADSKRSTPPKASSSSHPHHMTSTPVLSGLRSPSAPSKQLLSIPLTKTHLKRAEFNRGKAAGIL